MATTIIKGEVFDISHEAGGKIFTMTCMYGYVGRHVVAETRSPDGFTRWVTKENEVLRGPVQRMWAQCYAPTGGSGGWPSKPTTEGSIPSGGANA